jgi:ribose 5-phosphate isomerase B
MIIAIANDHAGRNLKRAVQAHLQELGHEVVDLGPESEGSVDYPLYTLPLAHAVAEGRAELGIFLCGSGLGPAIAANKVRGIRAVTCHDVYSAKSSRRDNNANVLTMGERVIGIGAALEVVKAWLNEPWSGEARHQRRLDQITEAENAF